MIGIKLFRWFSIGKNHYELLNISINAEQHEIKKAYLIQAKKYHPDSPDGNEEIFKNLCEAYEVLKNEEKKAEYDNQFFKKNKPQRDETSSVRSSEKNHKRYKNAFSTSN